MRRGTMSDSYILVSMPARLPQLFLVSEVAHALRIRPTNVRRLIREGRLRAHRLGNKGSHWRIPRAALEQFLLTTRIGRGWVHRAFWQL